MPVPFRPDTAGVVSRDVAFHPSRVARKSPLNRSFSALSALLLVGAASVARADNGVGAWTSPESWPIIAIHGVITPDGRLLTYGTTETGQQTGSTGYTTRETARVIHTNT